MHVDQVEVSLLGYLYTTLSRFFFPHFFLSRTHIILQSTLSFSTLTPLF